VSEFALIFPLESKLVCSCYNYELIDVKVEKSFYILEGLRYLVTYVLMPNTCVLILNKLILHQFNLLCLKIGIEELLTIAPVCNKKKAF